MASLALSFLCKRAGDMLWHSGSWPGLLGLFLSDKEDVRLEGLRLLQRDSKAWQAALGLGKASACAANLGSMAPRARRLISLVMA